MTSDNAQSCTVVIEGVPAERGSDPAEQFDPSRKFVRVIDRRADGFVEFHFAVGEPSLFVEMVLRERDFDDFCHMHQVELLDPGPGDDADEETADFGWTMHDATHHRLDEPHHLN